MTEKEYEALPEESRKLLFVAKLLPIDDKIEYCKWNLFAPSAAGSRDGRESGGTSKHWYQEFDEYSKVRLSRNVLRTLVLEADAGGWWPTEETLRSHLGPEIVRKKTDWWLDDYLKVRLDTIRLVRAIALDDEALLEGQDSTRGRGRWGLGSDSSVAAVAIAMGALAEEPLWNRLCLRDTGIALVEEWLTQAIFSCRDVRDTLECLRRHYGEHGTENTRLKQTYCAYCVWRGWRAGLELPALDQDPFAQGCRLILAGDLAKAHKLLFKFGDEGYRGDFATSLLIHAVCMAVKPSISRAVKIMKGDYYHSLDRFDEGRITEVRRLQDLHADVTELWSRQWGAGGAYLETNYFHCPMSMDGLHNVLRFAWDWSSKNNTARASAREVAKRLLPFIVRVVENGYVNLGGLFLSLMPELGAEPPSEPIKAAMKESGSWILPYQEAKPIWAQFLASLRNVLGVESARKPQKRASGEEAPAAGRIVWELSGGVSADGYVHLGLPQPYHRVLRPDGTEESTLIRLQNIPSQKYRSAVNAQDMALSAKLLAQERGLWRLPSAIAEALCGMPNLELVEGGNDDSPVRTPISLEARTCQMVSRVAEDGSTVLSLPAWRRGGDYAVMKTERPGVLAFMKLDEGKRELVKVFAAYGQDGKIVLPPEAAALNGDVLERLGEALPTEKLAEKAEEDLPEVKAKGESVVRLAFEGRCLVINVLVRPVKGAATILFEPGFGPEKRQVEGEKGPYLLVRDLEAERALFAPVRKALATFDMWFNGRSSWQIDDLGMAIEAVECLETMTPKPVLEWNKDKKLKLLRPKVKITADGKPRGWFKVGGTFSVDDGKVHDIMELLAALQAAGGAGRYVRLAGGEYVLLTEEIQRQLRALAEVGRKENGKLRIARGALPFLATMFGGEGLSLPAAMEKAAQMVRAALASTPEPPKTLAAQLRPYQLEGYRWLSRLASCGFGSCLADDMGLGKTLQTIALLLERAKDGASLVVAPASVCGNWRNEIHRFAPTLEPMVAMEEDEEVIEKAGPRSIVIASYGYLLFHEELFRGIPWNGIVLDEAQAIKNEDAKRTKLVKEFKANFRVAATGTPVENRIEEFWSIMDFLNPGLHGSLASVKPLILRRLKGDVLDDLPQKTEVTRLVELSVEERSAYEACRLKAQADLASADKKKRMGVLLAGLTRLRRFCCNPSLVLGTGAVASAKLEALAELMQDLREGGHRALVFSQFTDYLEIVQKMVEEKGWSSQYLDGETPLKERGKRVDAFQNGEGDFFLISLKAGGTGLNLTAADYVIILDPWWNPAVENQAADRAHRIGQRRPVTIYRLIAKDTVEERVLELHREKIQLSAEVLDDTASASLTGEELLGLLK